MSLKKGNSRIAVTESSGNVFVDLGFSNPDRESLKAKLALQIHKAIKKAIKERGLTQVQAGEIFGIKQPHVSSLMGGGQERSQLNG